MNTRSSTRHGQAARLAERVLCSEPWKSKAASAFPPLKGYRNCGVTVTRVTDGASFGNKKMCSRYRARFCWIFKDEWSGKNQKIILH